MNELLVVGFYILKKYCVLILRRACSVDSVSQTKLLNEVCSFKKNPLFFFFPQFFIVVQVQLELKFFNNTEFICNDIYILFIEFKNINFSFLMRYFTLKEDNPVIWGGHRSEKNKLHREPGGASQILLHGSLIKVSLASRSLVVEAL